MAHSMFAPLDDTLRARVVFMGTPDFAVPSLRALVESAAPGAIWPAGLSLAGVITRPDRPSGRGKRLVYSPVKQYALDHGLDVLQPGPLRRPEARQALADTAPTVIVVAAFGQLLPREILELPPYGCLNVHASLLPRWRGASPIAAAIRAGDRESGVTIMRMEEGLDTGDIIASRATSIASDETSGMLTDRLARMGAELLIETLPGWLTAEVPTTPQDSRLATMTRPLRKEDGRLDWTQPAMSLARQVRAMTPWPSAYTVWNGKLLKVLDAVAISHADGMVPGTCFTMPSSTPNGPLACACGEGALALRVIQLEGKRAAASADIVRGHPDLGSATLGD